MTAFSVTVTAKNQVTFPAAFMAALGLEKGSRVEVVPKSDGTALLREKKKYTFDDFRGALANHPISKKYTSVEIVKLASKIRAEKEKKKWGL